MKRFTSLCLVFLATCIPTFAWSDTPSQNKVGHAHTCQNGFPKEASETGAQGATTLGFLIGIDGNTRDVHIDNSSGNTGLDDAAVRCVQHWHYRPATIDTKPVEASWKAQVVWVLVEHPLDGPNGPEKSCIDQYPKEAAAPGIHGTTKLTVQVAADGGVKDAIVLNTSGSKELDDLAVVCVKKWRLSAEPEDSTKTAYVSWTIPYYPKK